MSDTEAHRTLVREAFESWRDSDGHVGDRIAFDDLWKRVPPRR